MRSFREKFHYFFMIFLFLIIYLNGLLFSISGYTFLAAYLIFIIINYFSTSKNESIKMLLLFVGQLVIYFLGLAEVFIMTLPFITLILLIISFFKRKLFYLFVYSLFISCFSQIIIYGNAMNRVDFIVSERDMICKNEGKFFRNISSLGGVLSVVSNPNENMCMLFYKNIFYGVTINLINNEKKFSYD